MELFMAEEYIGKHTDISVSRRTVNENFPVHWHDFFEIEIVLGGSGTHILNGNSYKLEKGYMYLLTPTDYHEVITDEGVEIFNIMFHENLLSDEFLNTVSKCKEDIIFRPADNEFDEILKLYTLLESECNKDTDYKEKFTGNLLECLLIHIFRKTGLSGTTVKKEAKHLQKAIQYIHLHFKDNPSLKDVAEIAGANPNYFSMKFKEETGKSYIEYLTERKLKYAKRLLESQSFTVTEICYASGFTSLSNFMRVFKKKTGKSPTQYIKKQYH